MDDVRCSGGEGSLWDCPHLGTHDCGGGEAAGVVCSSEGGTPPATLTPTGLLVTPSLPPVHPDQFCVTPRDQAVWGPLLPPSLPGHLLAITCDQCLEEVVCSSIQQLYEGLQPSGQER